MIQLLPQLTRRRSTMRSPERLRLVPGLKELGMVEGLGRTLLRVSWFGFFYHMPWKWMVFDLDFEERLCARN